jgi:2-C-methyl-D-erythritol 2,4-cyclodiphosphate synthase
MTTPNSAGFRIGQGWDTHALVEGRPLILGGVMIPHSKGLMGHSDADALIHAVIDALLGAAALGDIGTLFPDNDVQFKNADSTVLLTQALARVQAAGWRVGNVDTTIVAQAPRLGPYKSAMTERLATLLGVPTSAVNVKAKTAEKMGPVGEGLSIEAQAAVLLVAA